MRISAKSDYAVRAVIELAAHGGEQALPAETVARAQDIPHKFLEAILRDLRRDGIVQSVRGPRGGYLLARAADEVSVADVVRAVDGPLVSVRDVRPSDLTYSGAAEPLLPLWVGLRASVRGVLESVTVADLVAGRLPETVLELSRTPGAWENP